MPFRFPIPTAAPVRRTAAAAALLVLLASGAALAAGELGYWDYRAVMRASERLDHVCCVESLETDAGPVIAIGDRFGLVRLIRITGDGAFELWTSKQLNGTVSEVIAADLDGDGADEIVAWTNAAMVYVWSSASRELAYESLQNDFTLLHGLTVGNTDDDPQNEIVINADNRLYYLDGVSFNREWTSLREYQASRLAVGDVDGDGTMEIVLNSGQVVDARGGEVEWEEEAFGARIELVDMDGDGLPEVLTESDGGVLKIYDIDNRREKHLQ